MEHPARRIIRTLTATAIATVAALALSLAVNPTAANAGSTMLPAGTCYGNAYSTQAIIQNWANGNVVSYFTPVLRTPSYYLCHDVQICCVTANGGTVASMFRLVEGGPGGYAHPWHWVCCGFVVLATNVPRNWNFVIEEWKTSNAFGPVDLRVAA